MLLCFVGWALENTSAVISIGTPIILLIWFYYSQRRTLSKSYFENIPGIYGGFTNPISDQTKEEKRIYAGIIMNIRDIDDKGYFKGEFDFAETTTDLKDNRIFYRKLKDGVFQFYGKFNFKIYLNKTRHPFKPEENRVYKGKLYLVERLDFNFDNYKINNYLKAEFEIWHYREMQTLKFTFNKAYKNDGFDLPTSFILNKKIGLNFEPYINLVKTVFIGQTRVDK
jgi:hypothetical protein